MAAAFNDVYRSKFVLLTTFTKDGRPKPTPMRGIAEGDRLLFLTGRDSWKVKRIRNNQRVTIAACDLRGRPKSEAAEALANVLPDSETQRVYRAKVELHGKLYALFIKLRGGLDIAVGLEIAAASPNP
jgi:uncharacterized protein